MYVAKKPNLLEVATNVLQSVSNVLQYFESASNEVCFIRGREKWEVQVGWLWACFGYSNVGGILHHGPDGKKILLRFQYCTHLSLNYSTDRAETYNGHWHVRFKWPIMVFEVGYVHLILIRHIITFLSWNHHIKLKILDWRIPLLLYPTASNLFVRESAT